MVSPQSNTVSDILKDEAPSYPGTNTYINRIESFILDQFGKHLNENDIENVNSSLAHDISVKYSGSVSSNVI
eukprot:7887380-Ditylum_brightwellii.AAC.1